MIWDFSPLILGVLDGVKDICNIYFRLALKKFMFSMKATKIDIDWTLCCKCQIDGEDFVNFCGPLRKQELYVD